MKRLGLGPLLLAAGCLYYQPVNESPVVTIRAVGATSTIKGAPISLTVDVTDDQKAALPISYLVAAADGQPLDHCDYVLSPSLYGATVTFFRTGVFTVSALAKDEHGAGGVSGPLMVQVDDAPPVFTQSAALKPSSPSNGCQQYTAGQPITLHLDGDVSDLDAAATEAGCNTAETLHYTYRVVGVPDGASKVLTPFVNGACAARDASSGATLAVPTPTTQVCLWPDVGPAMGTASYSVVLDVADDQHTVSSGSVDVPVAGDQPPCITSTAPPAGDYVVDRTQTTRLEVTAVADDLDPLGPADSQLKLVWSVWRDSDPVFRTVPDWNLPYYDLDGTSFGVGEHARVRVEADDRGSGPATCDVSLDDCVVSSCAAGAGQCRQWKTWDLELR